MARNCGWLDGATPPVCQHRVTPLTLGFRILILNLILESGSTQVSKLLPHYNRISYPEGTKPSVDGWMELLVDWIGYVWDGWISLVGVRF